MVTFHDGEEVGAGLDDGGRASSKRRFDPHFILSK